MHQGALTASITSLLDIDKQMPGWTLRFTDKQKDSQTQRQSRTGSHSGIKDQKEIKRDKWTQFELKLLSFYACLVRTVFTLAGDWGKVSCSVCTSPAEQVTSVALDVSVDLY